MWQLAAILNNAANLERGLDVREAWQEVRPRRLRAALPLSIVLLLLRVRSIDVWQLSCKIAHKVAALKFVNWKWRPFVCGIVSQHDCSQVSDVEFLEVRTFFKDWKHSEPGTYFLLKHSPENQTKVKIKFEEISQIHFIHNTLSVQFDNFCCWFQASKNVVVILSLFLSSVLLATLSLSRLSFWFRLHTGETPYQCSYCQKKFTRKEHLTNHTRWGWCVVMHC